MSPAAIGPVKAMVLSIEAEEVRAFIETELAKATDGASLRSALTSFAKAKGVPI
ncbi:hypothetical protein MMMDOFMJ_0050 [Methylobacterium gnaphalii]|nr:hypothetical protein MMMDOFMJ_0050 [Methylobacterium gnaphalii]